MKAKKLNKVGCLTSKISLVCLLPAFCIGTANAQLDQGSKLYFQPEVLNLGQENTLSLMLDNAAEKVAGMDFVIQLPEYVDLVNLSNTSDNLILNTDRVNSDSHQVYLDKVAGKERTYKFTMFQNSTNVYVKGESGKLVDIKLNIKPEFLKMSPEQQTIKFSKVTISDIAARNLNDKLLPEASVRANMRYVMNVEAKVAELFAAQQQLAVFGEGQETVLNFDLDNQIALRDFQFDVKLPEGLELVEGGFVKGDRIKDHVVNMNYIASKGVTRFIVTNMKSTPIEGVGKSQLFGLKVKANGKLAAQPADVVLSNISFSDSNGDPYELDAAKNVVVKVQNLVADYNEVLAKIEGAEGLNKRLESAVAEVAKLPNVGKEWASADNAQQKAIVAAIAALKADLEKTKLAQAEADGLLAKKAGFLAEAERIQGLIAAYQKDAAAAQKAYEVEQAKLAANQAAFDRLNGELAGVQKELDAAKAQVAKDCKNVAAKFDAAFAEVQKNIDAKKADVKKSYDAKELTAESKVEVADVKAAMNKVVEDAKAAQKAYDEEQAKLAANEAAYQRLNAELAVVDKDIAAAKAKVGQECKDVAAQFDAAFGLVQKEYEALVAKVKAQYEAKELTAESKLDASAVKTALDKVVADAQEAQKAYDAEQAKLAANQAAFDRLNGVLAGVDKQIAEAKVNVARDCKDVAAQFDAAFALVQKDLEALVAEVKAAFDKKELTAESTVDVAGVQASLNKVVADAQAAQKAYEAEQAKLAANQAAFDRLNGVLAGVEKELADAKMLVARDCRNVAAQFDAAFTEVQKSIEAKKAEVKKAYDAKELTAESKVEVADVQAAMNKVVEDAKAAQKAFDEEQAKLSANEAAYNRLNSEIALVQMNLDAAKSTLARDYKDVAAQFDKAVAELQAQVDAMKAEVKKAYDAKELTAESKIDAAAVKAGVEKVLNDAAVAQKAYEAEQAKLAANEAANKRLNAAIADAQAQLDAAKASLAKDCKDVAAQFDKTVADLQAQLDKMVADVKKAYDAKELNAESTVATEGVKVAVANLLKDAQAAQKAFEDEQAQKAANEAAYKTLNEQVVAVQAELDKAKAEVAESCKDVAAQFDEQFAGLQAELDKVAADLKARYEAGKLNSESTVATEAVKAGVAKVVEEAKVAQKAYEDEQAKLAANEAAYKALNEQIAAAQAELEKAQAEVAENCKDVADQFEKQFAEFAKSFEKMAADVKKSYEAQELTAASKVDTESVLAEVAKVVEEAKVAQKAFEAAVEANEAAYQRLQKDIAGVQKELDAAIDSIQKNYAIVADQFKGEKVQEMIDDLKADLEGLYDNVELNEESTVDTEAVQEAIEQLLADAKEAYIATGIGSIYADDAEVEGIYTLGGQRVNAPVKGWNIVKYVNGKSKKVYVK